MCGLSRTVLCKCDMEAGGGDRAAEDKVLRQENPSLNLFVTRPVAGLGIDTDGRSFWLSSVLHVIVLAQRADVYVCSMNARHAQFGCLVRRKHSARKSGNQATCAFPMTSHGEWPQIGSSRHALWPTTALGIRQACIA